MSGAVLLKTPADADEQVAALPRRTAHAAYAIFAAREAAGLPGPVTAREVLIQDKESLSVQSTAAALASAQRHRLVQCWGGVWSALPAAYALRNALEDRFLADTRELKERDHDG